jgi:hypothetical protein
MCEFFENFVLQYYIHEYAFRIPVAAWGLPLPAGILRGWVQPAPHPHPLGSGGL